MSVYIWGTTPQQEETTTPKQIIINFQITKVSCGEEHMLFLSNTNQLYALGTNNYGVLGIGSDDYSERSLTPQLIQSNIIDMDCGWNHNISLNINNNAFVWGKVLNDITLPKQIGQSIRFVKCGARHTMMINNKNQLYAIGANDSGQCGIQNTKRINEVTHVMDNVLTVACGVSHSLIKINQQLLACGSNNLGQLGIQGVKNSFKPILVDIPKVDLIAAGNHSAAISCGNLYIWGSGCFGTFSKPTLFLNDIVDVKLNGTLGLGVDTQGQLYSWGSNVNGELGVGDTQTRTEAVKVLKNIQHFGVGINYAIAISRPPQPVTTEKEYLAKTLQIESDERSALEKINRELKSKFVELEQCNIDLRKLLDVKSEDIDNLQVQIENYSSTIANQESQIKDLKQQCQRHQTFQKDAISKLEKYEDYIDNLENQLKVKNEEIDGLTNQLQNFKDSLKQYQDDETSQLNQFKNQLSELTEQLNYEQQVNEQLVEQYSKERESFQQRGVLIQQYEFEIGNLQSQNKTLASQTSNSLQQHQKLSEGLTIANHRIESLQTQNAKLMQELSLLRTSVYSDLQKPQALEVQTIIGLNKELTDLNNQLQSKLREKDAEIIKLKSQLGNFGTLKDSRQSLSSQMKTSQCQNQLSQQNLNIPKKQKQESPNGKTIQELLESAHKHAKYMKKILKSSENFESDTPSPKKKLEFSKENSLIKNDSLSEVRERLNKLQQNRQLYEQKLRI
ncbi:unnamed protein product [Paramecium pentaurelia]|uniref:Uncharacterized protein n=1 Tax=Paramecium pentaurelia TaxID=43138 RepID=A0A8S1SSC2_9CILI|nr:unnamed protein product [Paramecium pentaurelia]